MFAACPDKAAVERAWLEHTVLWVTVVGIIMATGLCSTWEDPGLMALGASLAATTYWFPRWRLQMASRRQRRVKNHTTDEAAVSTLNAMFLGVVVLSLGMNYFQTPFFFDVLHMKFGFRATWRIDRNPVFLYLLTIPYFATYAACGCVAFRACARLLGAPPARVTAASSSASSSSLLVRRPSWLLHGAVIFLIATALAFFETLLNDNPFISNLFCYNDKFLALTFGSVCYGVSFVLALPVWLWYGGVHEGGVRGANAVSSMPRHVSWRQSVACNAVVVIVDAIILHAIRMYVAPFFTVVVNQADPSGGCLTPEPVWRLF